MARPAGTKTKERCITCNRPILAYSRLECPTCAHYRWQFKKGRETSSRFKRWEK